MATILHLANARLIDGTGNPPIDTAWVTVRDGHIEAVGSGERAPGPGTGDREAIDLEGRTMELGPRQGTVVPKGVLHRTRAPERTVILMVENAGIIPTGN